jgi:hypothetical protein
VFSTIWTQDALSSSCRRIATTVWRVVEAQHRISTMKLTDTAEEQRLLEALLEDTKPPVPALYRPLHYLLFTPFRYGAPYPKGSRFRRAGFTPGVFYASAAPETAIYEIAFHRLLFFAESPDTPFPKNPAEYTAFAVQIAADRALDLTQPPLNRDAECWTRLQDYEPCQALAEIAREIGITTIGSLSVRDPRRGMNYAVLDWHAFARPEPVAQQSWRMHLRIDGALAKCESPYGALDIAISDFKDDDRLLPLLSRAA